jgi:hypothetical protein
VLLHRFSAVRVERRLTGGNSSPVVVETEGGRFVLKLRGAGHGVLSLVAEIVVAELAERLSLSVPERALVTLPPDVPSADKNDELADLLARSTGTNLGLRLLDGARVATPSELDALEDEFVARVLWLDGFTMNPDRTPSNPNVLVWKQRPWLIDHGSTLAFHHDWRSVTEDSPREPWSYRRHAFSSRASLVARFDGVLAPLIDREALDAAAAAVPDEFLVDVEPHAAPGVTRAAYVAFLWKRLKPPRPFASDVT